MLENVQIQREEYDQMPRLGETLKHTTGATEVRGGSSFKGGIDLIGVGLSP